MFEDVPRAFGSCCVKALAPLKGIFKASMGTMEMWLATHASHITVCDCGAVLP